MKYLILGSSGQIGSHLSTYIKNRGDEVIEYDIVRDRGDDLRIRNSEKLASCIVESDFVFFLAFDVGGSRYLEKYQDSYEFIDNNMKIMSNTFDLLKRCSKPFIFTSSQMSDMGYSTYGLCKAIGEKFTNCIGGLNVRLWNVYGNEKDLEKSHVITDFINKARNTSNINMLTNGQEERQFLHADDCSECLYILSKEYHLLDRDKKYHITSFEWTSIENIAKIVCTNFEGATYTPSDRKDMVHQGWKTEPDKHILNYWKPKINLEEGIHQLIESSNVSN